ncbi:MAG: glycoside hydrolase family 25 protein [Bacteroidaceae bacterium]|nr:glycoside hydrolase family 25 protein [Bacteroidaceae bacterium]
MANQKSVRPRKTNASVKRGESRAASSSKKRVKPRTSQKRRGGDEEVKASWWKRLFFRHGELSPWVVWTGTGLVALAYLLVVWFFFFNPYLEGKRERELFFHRSRVHGLDVSHHQGRIDWAKLSLAAYHDAPINFVFMKATEGGDFVDKTFQANFASARECGLVRGAYHFFRPEVSAQLQAQLFMREVRLEPGDLPPVLDVEVLGKGGREELQQGARVWLTLVEKHYGVKPIIYASSSFRQDYLNDPFFDDYPYWIAHYYVPELSYKGVWKFWQHTDMGRLDGVDGEVDLDVFNGSLEELMKMTIASE